MDAHFHREGDVGAGSFRARVIGALAAGLLLATAGLHPGAAFGQQAAANQVKPVGKVQSVTGTVTIEHTSAVLVQANLPAGGTAPTKVDDPIYPNDVIQTEAGGTVGIIFGDGTSFNISENARMEINEFIYDPKANNNSTLFSLTKGTFTFLAGKAAKTGSMRVGTPVGTMGIRGTAPHVEIREDGTVRFTTLVEENKNAPPEAKPADPKPSAPEAPAGKRAAKDMKKLLDICRGC